jgi:hypothetical protein
MHGCDRSAAGADQDGYAVGHLDRQRRTARRADQGISLGLGQGRRRGTGHDHGASVNLAKANQGIAPDRIPQCRPPRLVAARLERELPRGEKMRGD